MNLYFIGINDLILQGENPFLGSITVARKFDSTKNNICWNDLFPNKKVDYNNLADLKKIDKFFIKAVKIILKKDKKAYFIRYNEHNLKNYNLKKYHILEMNSYNLYNLVNNKFVIREKLRSFANVLKYSYKKGYQIYKFLKKKFESEDCGYVVQEKYGFAGCNTFIIKQDNLKEECEKLHKFSTYAISVLQEENTPVNIHLFIDENKVEYYKPSQQIINTKNNQMNYDGASFDLCKNIENKIIRESKPIGKYLQEMGYRGVLGIDYILVKNKLYLMEINARFQSSTWKLNEILIKEGKATLFEKQINLLKEKMQ